MSLSSTLIGWKIPLPDEEQVAYPFRIQKKWAEINRSIPGSPSLLSATEEIDIRRKWLVDRFKSTGSLQGIQRRRLRQVPWFLFSAGQKYGDPSLAEQTDFVEQWISWLEETVPHSGTLFALLDNFLIYYPRHQTDLFEFWRVKIRALLKHVQRPEIEARWRICQQYKLLDSDGPKAFAEKIHQGDTLAYHLCEQAKLSSDVSQHGFVWHSYNHLLTLLAASLNTRRISVQKMHTVLEGFRGKNELFLVFGGFYKVLLVETLLRPFLNRKPTRAMQTLLQRFLLEYIGDPRTRVLAWNQVDPTLKEVMFSWLDSMPHKMDELLWIFSQEASEKLSAIQSSFMDITGRSNQAIDLVQLNQISRHAHAIQNAAHYCQLINITEISHVLLTVVQSMSEVADHLVIRPDMVRAMMTLLAQLQVMVGDVENCEMMDTSEAIEAANFILDQVIE
ncbi:MAG: Hpt domain-containing protein [Magnetococcales bacterium]|nr:Hpt domain-containing protein [Magnetococcales bacterium]